MIAPLIIVAVFLAGALALLWAGYYLFRPPLT